MSKDNESSASWPTRAEIDALFAAADRAYLPPNDDDEVPETYAFYDPDATRAELEAQGVTHPIEIVDPQGILGPTFSAPQLAPPLPALPTQPPQINPPHTPYGWLRRDAAITEAIARTPDHFLRTHYLPQDPVNWIEPPEERFKPELAIIDGPTALPPADLHWGRYDTVMHRLETPLDKLIREAQARRGELQARAIARHIDDSDEQKAADEAAYQEIKELARAADRDIAQLRERQLRRREAQRWYAIVENYTFTLPLPTAAIGAAADFVLARFLPPPDDTDWQPVPYPDEEI